MFFLLASLSVIAGEDEDEHKHGHDDHDEFEDHAAHEHGHAVAQISLSGSLLKVNLLLPSIDVFGFEHAPKNDEQHEKIMQSTAILKNADKIIKLLPNELCHIESAEVESEIIGLATEEDEHKHEHEHEHEGEQEEEHSDVNVHYTFKCSNGNPQSIEYLLFDHFSTLEEIEMQYVSNDAQKLTTITPDKRTQSLQ